MASIQKRENGKWRARYRDESGKEHARHFARKIDAQRWIDEVTASVVTGMYVDPRAGRINFADWYTQWADRQVWSPRTREAGDLAASRVPFAGKHIRLIRRAHIEEWVKEMSTSLAPATIETRFAFISMTLRGAVRDRLIAEDPCAGVKLPKKQRAAVAMKIPTPGQVGAAMTAAPREHRALVAVCAFAGLRLGEAAGLRADDLDAATGLLSVHRQVQGNSVRTTRIVPPKAGSERVIAVPSALSDIITTHVDEVGTIRTEGYLFTSGGDLLNRSSAGNIWRNIRDAAGLPDAFTLHSLRHFHASALISAGCDVVTVQRVLGHASATITLNTYAHLFPDAADRTRAATADLMAGILAPAD